MPRGAPCVNRKRGRAATHARAFGYHAALRGAQMRGSAGGLDDLDRARREGVRQRAERRRIGRSGASRPRPVGDAVEDNREAEQREGMWKGASGAVGSA